MVINRTIKLLPTKDQKLILNEWFSTTNYVYNKTIEEIEVRKAKINFQSLRNMLVTSNTRTTDQTYVQLMKKLKYVNLHLSLLDEWFQLNHNVSIRCEKLITILNARKSLLKKRKQSIPFQQNISLKPWECRTPKEIRANAVQDVVNAYKSGFTNLQNGNIPYFRMHYRKKKEAPKSLLLQTNNLKLVDGKLTIMPSKLGERLCSFAIGKRCKKIVRNMSINGSCRLIKKHGDYYLNIPIERKTNERHSQFRYCGVDLGLTDLATVFSNEKILKFKHNTLLLKKLNAKIDMFKRKRMKPLLQSQRTGFKKSTICKYEKRKTDMINQIHWQLINHLLKEFDVLFWGDIKSHDIVQNGKNRFINRDFNDLKFHLLRSRLLYKATLNGKTVILVPEPYTTKTCSRCGTVKNIEDSKVYQCSKCEKNFERDENSGKNMCIKGIMLLN